LLGFLLGLCCLGIAGCTASQPATPRQLARQAFHALQAGSAEDYQTLMVNTEEFKQVAPLVMDQDSASAAAIEEYRKVHRGYLVENLPDRIEQLHRIARQKEIPLQQAEFVQAQYRISQERGMNMVQNLDVIFRHHQQNFRIRLRDAVKLEQGWVLLYAPSVFIESVRPA
jgi:hypothetical protein